MLWMWTKKQDTLLEYDIVNLDTECRMNTESIERKDEYYMKNNENFVHLVGQILDCCVSLEVLENNESAYDCYKKVGFEEVSQNKIKKYTVMGKELNYLK
mgnify:CR=1 FL=1